MNAHESARLAYLADLTGRLYDNGNITAHTGLALVLDMVERHTARTEKEETA